MIRAFFKAVLATLNFTVCAIKYERLNREFYHRNRSLPRWWWYLHPVRFRNLWRAYHREA